MAAVERRSIAEVIGAAISRGELRWRPGGCDLDKIVALALAPSTMGRSGYGKVLPRSVLLQIADAVFRLKYANDPKEYVGGLGAAFSIAQRLNRRHNWRLHGADGLRRLAKMVFDYWLSDVCQRCSGRKFSILKGTPKLSERACGSCRGSGKRPYPWRKAPSMRARECHKAMLCTLDEIERAVCDAVVMRLRGR